MALYYKCRPIALEVGTTAPEMMLFPYNKEPDTGSRIPSQNIYEISEFKLISSGIISVFFDLDAKTFFDNEPCLAISCRPPEEYHFCQASNASMHS